MGGGGGVKTFGRERVLEMPTDAVTSSKKTKTAFKTIKVKKGHLRPIYGGRTFVEKG